MVHASPIRGDANTSGCTRRDEMTPKYVFSCSNSGFFLQLGQYFERVRYIGCRRYNRNDRILAHAVLEAIFSESLFFLAGTREWLLEDLPCESPVDECEDPNHLPNVKCHCSRCLRYRYFTLHPDFQEELVERLAQGAYADVPVRIGPDPSSGQDWPRRLGKLVR